MSSDKNTTILTLKKRITHLVFSCCFSFSLPCVVDQRSRRAPSLLLPPNTFPRRLLRRRQPSPFSFPILLHRTSINNRILSLNRDSFLVWKSCNRLLEKGGGFSLVLR
ncbi:hypothetical protein L1887_17092 [Cichorium endivia]|nr:hypothetical protein L1887_17092 [Cichorium endivia]